MNANDAKELISASADALALIREYLENLGGCDHSVNICMCRDIRVAERLSEILHVVAEC